VQGGSCSASAASAGFAAFAGPIIDTGSFAGDLAGHAVAGAAGARLAGGNAGNGALTAAFGYLFNSVGDAILRQTASPALPGTPYNPDVVNARIAAGRELPVYEINEQHEKKYLAGKDKLPADARNVYPHSVRVDLKTYIAMNEQGQYYRYFVDSGKAHYSGTLTVDEIKKYGYSKSLPEIHLNQKSYLIHQNFVTNPSKLQAIRSAIMNNR
jgi:hypothetical protein